MSEFPEPPPYQEPPPPIYQGAPPPWVQHDPNYRPAPQQRSSSALGKIFGPVLAVGAGLAKWGVVLFKVGKLGPTAISMVISIFLMVGIFGWQFGIGLLALIVVHESGHIIFGRAVGVPMSMPIFLGPLGAFVTAKFTSDRRQEVISAIGGPLVGCLGALLCAVLAGSTTGRVNYFLLGLANFGFFMNLFNMIPFSPFDGGRIAGAVSKWANVAGLALLAALFLGILGLKISPNPFLLIIVVFGVISLIERFRAERRGQGLPQLPPATRTTIALAYFGVLAFAALGMSITHAGLISGGIIT